jgi:hypothetical protein
MIDTDQLKPYDEAAQEAFKSWLATGPAIKEAEARRDEEGARRAREAATLNERKYDLAARALAMHLHKVISKAEREAGTKVQ